jgi:hypothetical protein
LARIINFAFLTCPVLAVLAVKVFSHRSAPVERVGATSIAGKQAEAIKRR